MIVDQNGQARIKQMTQLFLLNRFILIKDKVRYYTKDLELKQEV